MTDKFKEYVDLTYEEAKEYMRSEASVQQPIRAVMFSNSQKTGGSVLDVGCGNGVDAKRYDKSVYTGVDVSPILIRAARELNPGYKFRVCDAQKLPFKDRSFDNVMCKSLIEHLPSERIAKQVISEMARVCRKQLQIAWHTPPHPRATEIARPTGHFGKTVYQNRFNLESIIDAFPPKSKIEIHHIPNNIHLWMVVL